MPSPIRLGERARTYYAARPSGEAGITVRRKQVVRASGAAALTRTIALTALPAAVALVALLTGFTELSRAGARGIRGRRLGSDRPISAGEEFVHGADLRVVAGEAQLGQAPGVLDGPQQ